jgi:hypothetical protein
MSLSVLERQKFRVKIKSLAEESRIIKRQIKSLGRRWSKIDPDNHKLLGLRYSISTAQCNMNEHRIGIVRFESRHTLLAYAFSRGVPFRSAESNAKTSVDVAAVERIVKSLTGRRSPDLHDAVWKWVATPSEAAA